MTTISEEDLKERINLQNKIQIITYNTELRVVKQVHREPHATHTSH
jgi:hypothetical protein